MPLLNRSGWTVYKRLLGYSKRYWKALLLGAAGFMIYAQTQWVWAELIKYIVKAIEQGDGHARHLIALSIVGIFIVRGVGSFLGNYGIAYVARNVVHTLRRQMFHHMLYLKNEYYQHNPPGRMLSKITFNVEQVAGAGADAFKTILQEGFIVVGLLAYLFYSHWKLALLFFAIAPVIGWVVSYASKRLNRISRAIQESMGSVSHVSSETINAYETVKVYGAETYEENRFCLSSKNNLHQGMKLVVTQSLNTPLVQLIVACVLALVVWLALNPEIFGNTTAGEFLAFITAAGLLAKPIRQLTQVNSTVQKGIAGAYTIFELLDQEQEQDEGTYQIQKARGKIEFRNVGFQYVEDEPVLRDINVCIQPGEKVALVGRSGAGKTTFANLLLRFSNPISGKILLDDIPLDEITLNSLRRQIALVSQQFHLFNDTLRRNIAYGTLQACSDEQIWQAIDKAYARDFIQALPQRLDTLVGENGIQLSGGQRQRLALARAILKDAPILILDEATSALDQESEKAIQQALQEHLKDRTTLVIAHRLSTIESADKILVLDKGGIAELGTHQELIHRQGLYARLYQAGLKDE